jgi:hypothetical protein
MLVFQQPYEKDQFVPAVCDFSASMIDSEPKRSVRVFEAVEPAGFIEEIWARDLADVTWSMFRLRRILAALLDDQVRNEVDNRTSARAIQKAKFLEGWEKEEMNRLLDKNSDPNSVGKNVLRDIRAPMTSTKHFVLKRSPI